MLLGSHAPKQRGLAAPACLPPHGCPISSAGAGPGKACTGRTRSESESAQAAGCTGTSKKGDRAGSGPVR